MAQTRQLAAIMFTDVVGFTDLMGKDEDAAFKLIEKNRQLHKSAIQEFNGKWLKEMGDGVLLSFNSASDAVFCARKIQENCQKEADFSLRIGIHLGEVVFESEDVFGDGVNIASRIESITPPGCIYVSESVHRNVENKKEITTDFVGERTLKNVKHPIKIYQVRIKVVSKAGIASKKDEPTSQDSTKSIAILPFVNMSNDAEQEYFCDGLSEELLNALTQLDKFIVASRTSSFMFKGKNIEISEIGRKLNVETVLEGSVRKSQNRIRITAQLINVQDGFHLWSERYDREMTDIFDIQDEIALSILNALKLKLFGKEKEIILKRSTKNPEAYELYLKGRQNFHLLTPEGYLKAIECYNAAIQIEPNYSEAIAGVASCYLNLWHFEILPADQSLPNMIKATYKSMEIDDQIAESHLAMARLRMWYEYDMKEAQKEFQRTFEINPNIPDAISHYGFVESFLGNKTKALGLGKKSLELDPFSPMTNMNLASIFWFCQDLTAYKEQSDKIIDLYPNFWGGYYSHGLYYWSRQEYKKAIQSFNTAIKMQPSIWWISFVGSLYGIIGEEDKAYSMLAKMDEITNGRQITSFSYALVYAGLGDMDKTFDYLEKASEERTGHLIFLDRYRSYELIPAFNNNSRLQDFMDRAGIPKFKSNENSIEQ
jgi:TolB-like protein